MLKMWRVVLLLSLVTLVAYLVRSDIAVAQERMVPALALTMTGMGAITAWGFQLSYALFQVPAGMFGERFGARTTLMLAMLGCSVASLITSLMPADPTTAVSSLVFTRVLLGASQAAVFPVAAMAVMEYVPVDGRLHATAIYIASSSLGGGIAPLIMAPTMERFGWRAVFVVSSLIGLGMAIVWRTLMPPPTARPAARPHHGFASAVRELVVLLRNAQLRRLCAAYVLHSSVWFVFVFWFFRYLTEGRGFTILASGFWGSLPSVSAFVIAPLIGAGADRLGRRIGAARARRRVAMACLLGSASLVALGALLPSAIFAIIALSLSAGSLNGAESPFFMTATALGSAYPGAAAGVLNLMGNLGGVISIWLVPHMSAAWGWNGTLAFWAGVAVTAALIWLSVQSPDAEPAAGPQAVTP
jgi:ACS family glucarate transporter-like MFS transporter